MMNSQVIAAFGTEIYTFHDFINGHGAFYTGAGVTLDNYEYTHIENVENCNAILEMLIEKYNSVGIIPVVACENLSRDIYYLSQFLNSKTTRLTAKSRVEVLKIDILNEGGQLQLVFWDTKDFFVKKPEENATLKQRLALFWENFRDFENSHPYIYTYDYGIKVLTAVSVTRAFEQRKIYKLKGKNGRKAGFYRYWLNKRERALSDDMLYTIFACNKGGFNFCNSKYAGVTFDFNGENKKIVSLDATSHYPAQILTHLYPETFQKATPELLQLYAGIVKNVSVADVINNWHKPFKVAFHACFEVEHLHLKTNSWYEKNKVGTLTMNLFRLQAEQLDDTFNTQFVRKIKEKGYYNRIYGEYEKLFNKLLRADAVCIWLNELEWWLLNQVYDYNYYAVLSGYESSHFCKPADSSILSVMHFYRLKQELKQCLSAETQIAYDYVKRNLNSIYGREISVELYPTYEINADNGIVNTQMPNGVDDLPANTKTWMQFGQRVCGWGRVALVVLIDILQDFDVTILAGDTDSLKLVINENEIQYLSTYLRAYSNALDSAKEIVCERVNTYYNSNYIYMCDGIGHYTIEWVSEKFYTARNKNYAYSRDGEFHAVLSGIDGESTLDILAQELTTRGWNFREICEYVFAPDFVLTNQYGGKEICEYPPYCSKWVTQLYNEKTGEVTDVDAIAAPYRAKININMWNTAKGIAAEIERIEKNRSIANEKKQTH